MAATRDRSKEGDEPTLARNRAASHEYHLLDRWEAGIVLSGPEVKSARAGQVNLKGAYAKVRNGEVFLLDAHFSPYEQAGTDAFDPTRDRKLLLNRHEIRKIEKATADEGTTLVPLRLYAKGGRIKVEIAVGRGKKGPDKRDAIRERDVKREMDRERGARRVR